MHSIDKELNLKSTHPLVEHGFEIGSFSNASGDLIAELNAAAAKMAATKANFEAAYAKWLNHKNTRVEGGYCARTAKKKRRSQCQTEQQNWLNTFASRMNTAKGAHNAAKAAWDSVNARVKADGEAIKELARQGKTPDSVAQAAEIKAKSSASSKKLIVGGVVLIALAVTGFFLYRKFKKK